MTSGKTIEFGQQWPNGYDGPNKYWLGIDASVRTSHGSKLVLIRECSSLAELEIVGQQIHADVEAALAEARAALQPDPAPNGFQVQVGHPRSLPRRS